MTNTKSVETFEFQAEVSRLLKMMVHSVYSETEVFLRELVSNAADACDRRRYEAQLKSGVLGDDEQLSISVKADRKAKTLIISDNGIGMSRADLVDSLGTIARSGTAKFMESMKDSDDAKVSAPDLIGQFGIGFYSVFIVSDRVEVISKKAGESEAYIWSSDGTGSFEVSTSERASVGTDVILYLRDEMADEYTETMRLSHIIKTYSDHVPIPVMVQDISEEDAPKEGEEPAEDSSNKEPKQANAAQALWVRPKGEITKEEHQEFYRHVSRNFDEPWMVMHQKAEGTLVYTLLMYIPSSAPFDLYDSSRLSRLKLYVKRVFITQESDGLTPSYLRFLCGVVDCEDLPLNISREMLQNNPVVQKLQQNITRKTLSELKKKAANAPEEYANFWKIFGAVLKEGLSQDYDNQPELLELLRVRTTESQELLSLEQLKERMKEGQKALYYIVGENEDVIANSPHLEGFKARGIDIMLLNDSVDSFWTTAISKYNDIELKSVTYGASDLNDVPLEGEQGEAAEEESQEQKDNIEALIGYLKTTLGESVEDVVVSTRLTQSPVCLIAAEGATDAHLERFMKKYRQMDFNAKRILEINGKHVVIKALATKVQAGDNIEDAAFLLFEQARISEGEAPKDAAVFAQRFWAVMSLAYS